MSTQARIYGIAFAVVVTLIAGGFYLYVDRRGPAGPVETERTNIQTNAPENVEKKPPSAVDTPSPSDAK